MRRLRAAATALVAVLALSACNGGDDPDDPKSSSTPSGSPSVPSTPTTDPLTEAPPGETARQFIRRWVALGNQMQATGETEAFLAVAGPDCDSCEKFANQMSQIYKNGGAVRGGGERISEMKRESTTVWVITRVATPSEYTESADGELKRFPGGDYRSRIILAKVDGEWIVAATEGVRS